MRREVVMLQRLEHPNIIKMYEIMETENSYYLVLELAYAGDFVNYLAEKYVTLIIPNKIHVFPLTRPTLFFVSTLQFLRPSRKK